MDTKFILIGMAIIFGVLLFWIIKSANKEAERMGLSKNE